MASKNNKKNIIKKMITLLLVILILLVIMIIILLNNPTDKNLRFIYSDKLPDDVSMPLNINKGFKNYHGTVNRGYIYKALDVFAKKQLPKYYKDLNSLDEDGIRKYFEKNQERIYIELGLNKVEDFIELSNTIKKFNNGNFEFIKYTINPLSVDSGTNRIYFALILEYKDQPKVAVEVSISNMEDKSKTPTKIKGGVDDKYLDYTYSSGVEDYPDMSDVISGGAPGRVVN